MVLNVSKPVRSGALCAKENILSQTSTIFLNASLSLSLLIVRRTSNSKSGEGAFHHFEHGL